MSNTNTSKIKARKWIGEFTLVSNPERELPKFTGIRIVQQPSLWHEVIVPSFWMALAFTCLIMTVRFVFLNR